MSGKDTAAGHDGKDMSDICVIWCHMLREACSRAFELAAEDHASSQKEVYSLWPGDPQSQRLLTGICSKEEIQL